MLFAFCQGKARMLEELSLFFSASLSPPQSLDKILEHILRKYLYSE